MDQPFYPSNILLNSVETPTLAEYLLSPDDTDMDYLNMASQEANGLDIWNSHDATSSSYRANQGNHDATKMDHGWNTSLSINSAGEARMEERQCERNNIVSLESEDFNLNNTPSDDGHSFRQNLDSSHADHRAENNAHADPHSEFTEVSLCPFMPEFFDPEHVPYSNSHGSSSSAAAVQLSENDNRARSAFDGQRVVCKRKSMEHVIGESSTSRNISTDLSIPSSSRYLPASFLEDNHSPNFIPVHGGLCPEWNSTSSFLGNAETFQRNFRARLNPTRLHDTSLFQPHSSNRLPSIWSTGEPSSILNPFNHFPEQIQPQGLSPSLPPNINHSSSSSRNVSSSLPVYGQRRLIASPEQTNIRSLPRIGMVDQPTFYMSTAVSQLVQDPPSWNPSNSSSSAAGNRASSSSVVIPSPAPIRIPSEMVPPQYHRNMADILRCSSFQSGASESGHQSNSAARQSGRSAAVQEPGQSSRIILQGHSPLYPRAAVPVDRQRDGVSGLNFPARSREGRNRMISEIRNALDLMRRGVNLRFESAFYGRADLHDRHRDMRLDVDNMSYEELLALEERIGYVNTGLSEETILKRLRQRKYSPCDLEVASAEQEPCCICREDYKEGEEIVTLDCKHDFHTPCIKEWLMNKNLCPICKTTALVT